VLRPAWRGPSASRRSSAAAGRPWTRRGGSGRSRRGQGRRPPPRRQIPRSRGAPQGSPGPHPRTPSPSTTRWTPSPRRSPPSTRPPPSRRTPPQWRPGAMASGQTSPAWTGRQRCAFAWPSWQTSASGGGRAGAGGARAGPARPLRLGAGGGHRGAGQRALRVGQVQAVAPADQRRRGPVLRHPRGRGAGGGRTQQRRRDQRRPGRDPYARAALGRESAGVVAANTVGLAYPSKSCGSGYAIRSFNVGSSAAPTCIAVGADGYNPNNQPGYGVRGEPTRNEIESWGGGSGGSCYYTAWSAKNGWQFC